MDGSGGCGRSGRSKSSRSGALATVEMDTRVDSALFDFRSDDIVEGVEGLIGSSCVLFMILMDADASTE